jgi:hypothetical protein
MTNAPVPADRTTRSWLDVSVEYIGIIVSMTAGALCGFIVPGNGIAWVSLVALMSFIGFLFWTRRREPLMHTMLMSVLMLVLWWPIAALLRQIDLENRRGQQGSTENRR